VLAHDHSRIEESVIMSGCQISHNARIRRAILDKNVVVPAGEQLGWNLDLDRRRFSVSDSGIVVVSKGYNFSTPP
jgi:glucose-1-phosphate adenylyltransferase